MPARPGPADAVDVGLGLAGQIEVQDVRDALHVEAASRNIGCHQHFRAMGREVAEDSLPGRLALASVERVGRNPRLSQLPRDTICVMFRARKDEREGDGLSSQVIRAARIFFCRGTKSTDCWMSFAVAFTGAMRMRTGSRRMESVKRATTFGHGGGEHQGLPPHGQLGDDPANVGHEAHIEHAVRFVQDEDLDSAQVDEPLVHQVEQPAGRGNEDIDAPLQGSRLRVLADTAEDHRFTEAGVQSIRPKAVADLRSQFPGGREDQSPNPPSPSPRWILGLHQTVQNGQRECRGFPCARLREPTRSRPATTWGMASD